MAPPELEDGPVLSSPAPLACFIKCGPCLDPHVFPPCHQAHPKPALCLLGGPSLGPFSPASGSHGLAFAGAASWPPSPSSALLSSKPRCAEHPAPPLRESVLAASLSWASLGPSRASLSYPRSLNLPAVLAPASGASLPPCPPARPWGHCHQKAFLSPTRKGSDPPEVSVRILFGCSLCTCHAVP